MKLNDLDEKLECGVFPAICGGYVSTWKDSNGNHFTATFTNGVRGMNIGDTITVTQRSVESQILGIAFSVKKG